MSRYASNTNSSSSTDVTPRTTSSVEIFFMTLAAEQTQYKSFIFFINYGAFYSVNTNAQKHYISRDTCPLAMPAGAHVGNQDDPISFWEQKVKDPVHISTLGGISPPVCRMHGLTSMNLIRVTHLPGPHDTDDIWRAQFQWSRSRTASLAEAYWSMVLCCRPSSFIMLLFCDDAKLMLNVYCYFCSSYIMWICALWDESHCLQKAGLMSVSTCALGRTWLWPQRWTACCPPRR